MWIALAALLALGPEIVPSTPALQPAEPSFATAIATDHGFEVAYSSANGIAVAELDAAGVPLHEQATVRRTTGRAFPGDLAGELVSYSSADGAGVWGASAHVLDYDPFAINHLVFNGREYLFVWNDGQNIYARVLDRSGTPIGAPLTIRTWTLSQFNVAAADDGFLITTITIGFCGSHYCLTTIPVSEQGGVGTPKYFAADDNLTLQRQALVGTHNGYLLFSLKTVVALDREGNPRGPATQIINDNATFLAATASDGGAMAVTDHGVLLSVDENARITRTSSIAPLTNAVLTASDRSVLIVTPNGTSVVDKVTRLESARRPIATLPAAQSAPLLAAADDGTILASWEIPNAQRRLGRIRENVPIDGDGISIDGSSAAIGTNGRDFLVATGGSSLAISFLGATGPLGAPHIIDTNVDHADSIVWNGRNYVVFFTRFISGQITGTCGTWREQIYAAIVNNDLATATIQPIALPPASQKNALAVKTRNGIALAYSPAYAVTDAGGFTFRCRDTTDVSLAQLDDDLRLVSDTVLSARGLRDDETPLNVVSDGKTTIVTWLLVIDPHNDGTRIVNNFGAMWDGSRIVTLDPSQVPSDSFVSARGVIGYIRPSLDLGLGDSYVMVVRSVTGAPARQRPLR